MEKYILSIDAGTSSSRALIIDKKGNKYRHSLWEDLITQKEMISFND